MKKESRDKARQLRQEGISVNKIAQILNVSKGTVSIWVRDIPLTIQQTEQLKTSSAYMSSQALKKKFKVIQDEGFDKGYDLASKSENWRMLCLLYWTEGTKYGRAVKFTNGDPSLILLFFKLLMNEFPNEKNNIKIYFQCHGEGKLEEGKMFWSQLLDLSINCFWKPSILPIDSSRYTKLPYGICTLNLSRSYIRDMIHGGIEYIKDMTQVSLMAKQLADNV